MRLSIVIPYYNAEPYTSELLNVLAPQMQEDMECIVIDDGSNPKFTTDHEWVKVIRKKNGGAASARNKGLDIAKGEYICFIDSDDLVPEYYVEKILEEIERSHADVIDFSWRSLDSTGTQFNFKLNSTSDYLKNPSVCTRAFKKSYIGNSRMNEQKDATEDEDFARKLGYLEKGRFTHSAITDYMYLYRTGIPESNVKSFKAGLTKTKRIVYHYDKVTRGMTWLLEEIKAEDMVNEVCLVTGRNEIPELKRYCQIMKQVPIWGHELRGDPYGKFTLIEPPIKAQLVLYCGTVHHVNGITTFLYNTCQQLKSYYDILLLFDSFDAYQLERFTKIVRVMKNNPIKKIACDALILNRLNDVIPPNIIYKRTIQVCHTCYFPQYSMPWNRDFIVNVSQFSKDTWGKASEKGVVIHNMSFPESNELMLVSATRMLANDKGENENRFRKLAQMLNDNNIPFVWLNFSDKPMPNPPKNFINMAPRVNIQSFIKRADYLVQLSDVEAYSMSILEALTLNTPVISTAFPSLYEAGFKDGVTGYVVPYNMIFDVKKLLTIPKFNFEYDNNAIIKQWKDILEAPIPERKTEPVISDSIRVKVLKSFQDKYTGRMIPKGYTTFTYQRVREILEVQRLRKVKLIEVEY